MQEERMFTQAELDEVIKNRLAREKANHEAELVSQAESIMQEMQQDTLQEQEKYRELYESIKHKLDPLQARAAAYEAYFESVLDSKLKTLGKPAEKATAHLTSAFDKLNWLEANSELFENKGDTIGTPKQAHPARQVPRPTFKFGAL